MSKSTRKDTVRWMDWYWNRGGREKVQVKRYIREYERERTKANEAEGKGSKI